MASVGICDGRKVENLATGVFLLVSPFKESQARSLASPQPDERDANEPKKLKVQQQPAANPQGPDRLTTIL